MTKILLAVSVCAFALPLSASDINARVVDPSGAPVSSAGIAVAEGLSVSARTATGSNGSFRLTIDNPAGAKLIVTAAGFERKELSATAVPAEIQLDLAPLTDSLTVAGTFIDVPLSEQGASTTIITRKEIAQSNEAAAADLLRSVPGVTLMQSGFRGGVTSLFVRGGDSKFNLVTIDGIPVNDMRFGGGFNFANIPTDYLERVEVTRGAQSAVYGSYANASVVNFVTRLDEGGPHLSALAEGGTFSTRRFAVNGGGSYRGFRAALFASQLDTAGMVSNDDYRNQNLGLNLGKRFGAHDISFRSSHNASRRGVPGPYGANPVGNFPGIDPVSREFNNFSDYGIRYEGAYGPRVRQQLFGSFFLNNNTYESPFGPSYNRDMRGLAESRTTVEVSPVYSTAFGIAWSREQVRNTFITDASFLPVDVRRGQEGIYWENRLRLGSRLFVNAGVRADIFHNPAIPPDSSRPAFDAYASTKVNPKLSAAYRVTAATRVFGSFGLGIRPPGGFDLAFTDNTRLRPERTMSFDAGVERQFGRRASVNATYFYNRYYDLIVSLGGSLAGLGRYRTDNLANSSAQGLEFSAQVRPNTAWLLDANYTYLDTQVLSLDGSNGLAPQYYRVGQQLTRRPRHSGAARAGYTRRRFSANASLLLRGQTLDVEPNFGAFSGFFVNGGYANAGVNLNYNVGGGVTAYVNLRNVLNRSYEEIYGYPSPKFNFVAGLKWTLSKD